MFAKVLRRRLPCVDLRGRLLPALDLFFFSMLYLSLKIASVFQPFYILAEPQCIQDTVLGHWGI